MKEKTKQNASKKLEHQKTKLESFMFNTEAKRDLPDFMKYLIIFNKQRKYMLRFENLDATTLRKTKTQAELESVSSAFLDLDYPSGTFMPLVSKLGGHKWMGFVNAFRWSVFILFPTQVEDIRVESLIRQIDWFVKKLMNDYLVDEEEDPKLKFCLVEFLKIVNRKLKSKSPMNELKIYHFVTRKHKSKLLSYLEHSHGTSARKGRFDSRFLEREIQVNDFQNKHQTQTKAEAEETTKGAEDGEVYSMGQFSISKKSAKAILKVIFLGVLFVGILGVFFSLRNAGPELLNQVQNLPENTVRFFSEMKRQIRKIWDFVDSEFFKMQIVSMKHKPPRPAPTSKHLKLARRHKAVDFRNLIDRIPNRIILDSPGETQGRSEFHFRETRSADLHQYLI